MNDLPHDLPLSAAHGLDDIIAWRPDGPRRVRDLLAEAAALARHLPPGGHLLNVCQDRWRFAAGFLAGLVEGRVSLQPASQSAETLHRLQAEFPDACVLHDGDFDGHGLPCVAYPETLAVDPANFAEMPTVPADRLAAILFTSGSTGLPQPHRKTWGKLVASGRAEARALGLDRRPRCIVGTVPIQHSYGFESTLMMPLHGGGTFWSGKPFYPQDIAVALNVVPAPRLLVSTPFHLSALLAAELELPDIDAVLSATAPLSNALAARVEAATGAPVLEIYGSTESGQLAWRRTLDDAAWALLDGVRLTQHGEQTTAGGGHVEGEVPLSDIIELLPDGRFLLHGRQADLVNIAGKRTSLGYLNHQITALPGVVDAAFYLPDDTDDRGVTRLAAFAVAPDKSAGELLAALRERVDAIFLPRPLLLVEALPRNSTGKLPRDNLRTLYAEKVGHGRAR